jgi:hypothetical protein
MKHRLLCVLSVSLSALLLASCAQTPLTSSQRAGAEVIDSIKLPPGKTMLDFQRDSNVTTRQDGDNTVTEYRLKGKLYKVVVKPASGPGYTLIDEKGEGKFVRMGEIAPSANVPMRVLLSW